MKEKQSFDYRTQKLNKKGQVISRSPYRLYVEGGIKKLERPPGSGNFFYENGQPVPKKKEEEKK
jgi:hypothetical protein